MPRFGFAELNAPRSVAPEFLICMIEPFLDRRHLDHLVAASAAEKRTCKANHPRRAPSEDLAMS
jgi:hypothetical protein